MADNNAARCPVSSHIEWGTLKEVVLGTPVGATVPALRTELTGVVFPDLHDWFRQNKGELFPPGLSAKGGAADKEVQEIARVLREKGIKVRFPTEVDWTKERKTKLFSTKGLYGAMPRDILLPIGNKMIVSTMAWRCRKFEHLAYEEILAEFESQGAEVIRCSNDMPDELYTPDERVDWWNPTEERSGNYFGVNEHSACFDAADFTKHGYDIFAHRSHVTNLKGIQMVRDILGPDYNVHAIQFKDNAPMHIDGSMTLLGEKWLLLNPKKEMNPKQLAEFQKAGFRIDMKKLRPFPSYMAGEWLSCINCMMLDEKTVLVDADETATCELMESLGLECVKVHIRNAMSLGGSTHCYTSDVRREGEPPAKCFEKDTFNRHYIQ